MNGTIARSLADAVAIAIALWFLFADTFGTMDGAVLDSVALVVIGTSLWRLWRRHRPGSPP
ncbi:MAG: hypothetical protein WBA25_13595 [Jannaschia sp.]